MSKLILLGICDRGCRRGSGAALRAKPVRSAPAWMDFPRRARRELVVCAAALLMATGAYAERTAPVLADRLGPAAKLAVPNADAPQPTLLVATTRPSTPSAVPATLAVDAGGRPLGAKRLAKMQARGLTGADPAAADRPAVPSLADAPLPPLPRMAEGARLATTPVAAPLPVRIPNLLASPRRAAFASANPVLAPAGPISTSPVGNVDGGSALPALGAMVRRPIIDVSAPPTMLGIDEAPYVRAPGADDAVDAPAPVPAAGVRPRME